MSILVVGAKRGASLKAELVPETANVVYIYTESHYNEWLDAGTGVYITEIPGDKCHEPIHTLYLNFDVLRQGFLVRCEHLKRRRSVWGGTVNRLVVYAAQDLSYGGRMEWFIDTLLEHNAIGEGEILAESKLFTS